MNLTEIESFLTESVLEQSGSPPVDSPTLQRLVARLRAGQPIVATAIGQSNTASHAGCFGGRGCAEDRTRRHLNATRPSHGWAGELMQWINATWPHPRHELYNHAAGASNSKFSSMCLANHLAPKTDLLLVDYNLGGWDHQAQEHFARTAAVLAHPPFVLYVGLLNWCPPTNVSRSDVLALMRKQKDGPLREYTPARIKLEGRQCRSAFASRRFTSFDAIGDTLARVAAHYGQGFVSVFRALRSVLGSDHPHLHEPLQLTQDGIHGTYSMSTSGPKRSAYYTSLTAMLIHYVRKAAVAYLGATEMASSAAAAPLPPTLHPDVTPPSRMLACHGWDPIIFDLPAPRVLRNTSVEGGGWHYNEFTTNGTRQRKPGLVSLQGGDAVDLEVAMGGSAAYARREGWPAPASTACIGLTYLESYELMGVVNASCLPPCACLPRAMDALNARASGSLFHTIEVEASVIGATCALRLVNEGRPGSVELSKFRLSGMYVRRAAAQPSGERAHETGTTLGEARSVCERAPNTPRLSENQIPGVNA